MSDMRAVAFRVTGERKWEIIEADRLQWLVATGTGDDIAVYHEMEPAGRSVHDWICQQFSPGLVFLDVGAHVGHYSLRAAAKGCKVIAVEASPDNAALLQANRDLNDLDFQIWAFAAWDEAAVLEFAERRGGPERAADKSLRLPETHDPSGVLVSGVPLDAMQFPDGVGFVKMDVEGSDVQTLRGMMGTIVRHRPVLLLEDHTFYGTYTGQEMGVLMNQLTAEAGYVWCDLRSLGVQSDFLYIVGTPDGDSGNGDSS